MTVEQDRCDTCGGGSGSDGIRLCTRCELLEHACGGDLGRVSADMTWLNNLLAEHPPTMQTWRYLKQRIYDHAFDYDCDPHNPLLVHFTTSNGVVVYQQQCRVCHKKLTSALAYKNLTQAERAAAPPRFPTAYRNLWARRQIMLASIGDFWDHYPAYLSTLEWAERSYRVRARSNWVCERCGGSPTVAHHLTYERVGNELDSDLIALCPACHQEQHPHKDLSA